MTVCSPATMATEPAALDIDGVRPGTPTRRCGRLLEPLVKPGTDLLGRQLRPLPLLTGDDGTGCRDTGDTGETGETENLPEVHDEETFRE